MKQITDEQIKEAASQSVYGMEKSFDGIEVSLAHTGFEQGAKWMKEQQPSKSFIDFLNEQGLDRSLVNTAYGLYVGWIKENS